MIKPLGRACASRLSILSTFFAVFFVACAYFYFQYSYTKLVNVNFDEWVLYQGEGIFTPSSDRYTLYFYNSQSKEQKEWLERASIPSEKPVVAIDIYQYKEPSTQENLIFASAGINTILHYIHRFKITELPAVVEIERKSVHLYRQSAKTRVIPARLLTERPL